jgi:hypothetical protein
MSKILSTLLLCAFASFSVQAASPDCEAKAAEKKLAGAAKASFMKKCEQHAAAAGTQAQCEAQANEKKLKGAARNSFMKKCEKGAAAK